MIEEAIYSKLNATAGITSLVSSRIYPYKLPEAATLPAIVYSVISTEHFEDMQGSAGGARSTFEFEAWAKTATEARDLGEAIRNALQGYTGTVSGTRIDAIIEWFSHEAYEDDAEMYQGICQCTVWHQVNLPS